MSDDYLKKGRVNQKSETRSKILKSAQHFLNNGYDINLEDVAKHSGISRATIYRYFSNVDVLSAEAGLDVNTLSPETIYADLDCDTFFDKVLDIQEYYNNLTIDNEQLFRKYLSAVLGSQPSSIKRGARRKKTLQLVLADTSFSKKEREDLSNLLTVLMGVEPFIVTKDVCGLNNDESKDLLRWGIRLILKGLNDSK